MGPKCSSDDVGQPKPNTQSEIHQAMFSLQYKQRKKRKLDTQRDQARPELEGADQSIDFRNEKAQQKHPTRATSHLKKEQKSSAKVKQYKARDTQ